MLCENCHLNDAEVKVVVKGHEGVQEKWLCTTCANGGNPWNENQQIPSQDNIEESFVVKQILQHLAAKHGLNIDNLTVKEEKRCPTCQMTLKDIANVGKFGCADCYATFKDDITDIVKRVQGGQFQHTGKTPYSSHRKLAIKKQIEDKTAYLNQLIEIQNFEEAAVVRDEINALKAESEGKQDANEHDHTDMNSWMYEETESPVVISSRIRLARNLQNHVHPLMFPSEQAGFRVINEVQDALPDLKVKRLDDLDQLSKHQLVAQHLISPELLRQPASAVLLNDDHSISVMVNEEDHVRIQAMSHDLALLKLFEKASSVDDQLDEALDISFDEDLGYLTTCPTNIGTGMHAGVMLHLPGLSIMKRMNRIAQTINRFGFTIRGIYGEGSQVFGHIYQVSNQLTLGKTESEIIERLIEIVQQIINEELQLRERLARYNHIETIDRVYRSLGILQNCRLLSMEEASYRLSEVKLGIDLGYIELEHFDFNQLMVQIQSPFLIDETDDKSVSERRADVLREQIK